MNHSVTLYHLLGLVKRANNNRREMRVPEVVLALVKRAMPGDPWQRAKAQLSMQPGPTDIRSISRNRLRVHGPGYDPNVVPYKPVITPQQQAQWRTSTPQPRNPNQISDRELQWYFNMLMPESPEQRKWREVNQYVRGVTYHGWKTPEQREQEVANILGTMDQWGWRGDLKNNRLMNDNDDFLQRHEEEKQNRNIRLGHMNEELQRIGRQPYTPPAAENKTDPYIPYHKAMSKRELARRKDWYDKNDQAFAEQGERLKGLDQRIAAIRERRARGDDTAWLARS